MITLPNGRKASIIIRRFCKKCGFDESHVLWGRRVEAGIDDETYTKVEFSTCEACETVAEHRTLETYPTDANRIVGRLLKLVGEYEQIKSSHLEVGIERISLSLDLLPWSVVKANRRIIEAGDRGFYNVGDLWILEKEGRLKWPLTEIPVSRTKFSLSL